MYYNVCFVMVVDVREAILSTASTILLTGPQKRVMENLQSALEKSCKSHKISFGIFMETLGPGYNVTDVT